MAFAQNFQLVPTDFQYLKYVKLNVKGSHRRHDYNFQHKERVIDTHTLKCRFY